MPASLVDPGGMTTLLCNYFERDGVLTSVREYQPDRFRTDEADRPRVG